MIISENIKRLEIILEALGPLADEMVFTGGAVVELYIHKQPAHPLRTTNDVDCIISASTRLVYQQLEEHLHKRGFKNIGFTGKGGPLCRYDYKDILFDVMPASSEVLGFTNRWFAQALANVTEHKLPSGKIIRLTSLPIFLAIKFETMLDRGKNDLRTSHDLEDIITLLDGARDPIESISHASPKIKNFIQETCRACLGKIDFPDAIEACSPAGSKQAARILALLEQMSVDLTNGKGKKIERR